MLDVQVFIQISPTFCISPQFYWNSFLRDISIGPISYQLMEMCVITKILNFVLLKYFLSVQLKVRFVMSHHQTLLSVCVSRAHFIKSFLNNDVLKFTDFATELREKEILCKIKNPPGLHSILSCIKVPIPKDVVLILIIFFIKYISIAK